MEQIYSLDSKLIYGVAVSEEFVYVITELDSHIQHNNLYYLEDNTVLGVSVPHNTNNLNPQSLLFEFSNVKEKVHQQYLNVINEIKEEAKISLSSHNLEKTDYNVISEEMVDLENETPNLYLYATQKAQTLH